MPKEDNVYEYEVLISHSYPGWMWADAGMLYFLMRKQDIEKRDWDKAWMILQTS